MSEVIINVEDKIEEANDNVMEPIDNNAIDDQVELPVDPTEPEVEPSDDEDSAAEKAELEEFEKEMEEIMNEAIPEVDATLDPDSQLSETSERSVEIGGYNPEAEEGKSELVDAVVDACTPVTAEFVPDEIEDANTMLDASPDEYTFNQNEVLVETEDDKVEDVTDKVEDLEGLQGNQVINGDVVISKEDGEIVSEISLESEMEEVADIVEKMIENMGDAVDETVTPQCTEPTEDNLNVQEQGDSFEEVNENAQIGEIEISNIQIIDGNEYTTDDVDITLPSIAETPLDDVTTDEVIHLHTLEDSDIDKNIEEQVRAMIGTESGEIDLNLGIVDGNQVVEKGEDGEVIVGDFTEIVMSVTAEANKDVDGEALEPFEITSTNPDEHVVIDETDDIEKAEGGPIAGSFDEEDYSAAFDAFIEGENSEPDTYDVEGEEVY